MEFFKIRKDIPFMRHALVFNVISLVTFIAAVFFLATRGLHFSVEFTGGTLIEVSRRPPTRRRSATSWPGPISPTPRWSTSAAAATC